MNRIIDSDQVTWRARPAEIRPPGGYSDGSERFARCYGRQGILGKPPMLRRWLTVCVVRNSEHTRGRNFYMRKLAGTFTPKDIALIDYALANRRQAER